MEYSFYRKPFQNEGKDLNGLESGKYFYEGFGKFSFQIESSKGLKVHQKEHPSTLISISSSRKLENNKKDPSVGKFLQVFEKKRQEFERKRENLEKNQFFGNDSKFEKIFIHHLPNAVVEDEWEEITIEEDARMKKRQIYPSLKSLNEAGDNLELSFSSSYDVADESSSCSTQTSVKNYSSDPSLSELEVLKLFGINITKERKKPDIKDILKTFSLNKRLKCFIDKEKNGNNGIMTKKFYSLIFEEVQLISERLEFPYEFAMQPVKFGHLLKCQIIRDKKRATYFMRMERENGRMFIILTARKIRSFNSNYIISTDSSEMTRYSSSYSGELCSNMLGTQFTVFDNGENPHKYKYREIPNKIREELALINYEKNIFGLKARKMRIVIPLLVNESQRYEFLHCNKRDSIFYSLKYIRDNDSLSENGLIELRNKTPKWCDKTKCHVLNFQGRVTKASVKNFQIIHEKYPDYIILQFGKVSKDVFTLDIQFPLCPLQAFAIALSSIDKKLACK